MSNTSSSLYTHIAPAHPSNYTERDSRAITEITVHHMAGNMSVQALGELWQNSSRNGSSHYGVNGKEIGLYVSEKDIAWTNSDWESNQRAVTIETANNGGAPDWTVSDETLATLITLVADIAKRNNLGKLIVKENLTMHKQYSATACPGSYLESKFQYIADEVNKINGFSEETPVEPETETDKDKIIAEQNQIIINLENEIEELKDKNTLYNQTISNYISTIAELTRKINSAKLALE